MSKSQKNFRRQAYVFKIGTYKKLEKLFYINRNHYFLES